MQKIEKVFDRTKMEMERYWLKDRNLQPAVVVTCL